MKRWGMVIDLKRCIGCNSCTLACKIQNGTPPGIFYRRVLEKTSGKYPAFRRTYLPVQCMHCEDPPCVAACPSGVFSKREDGIVIADTNKCYGAKACRMACPYHAITFLEEIRDYFPDGRTDTEKVWYENHRAGTANKCNFCADRVDEGLEPACVQACPTATMIFGDLNDPHSEASMLIRARDGVKLHSELGTNPAVYYVK
jgi:Fe-S-cluster-containing dehydrogenase component